MTDKYEMTMVVPAKLIGTIVEIIDKEGIKATIVPARESTVPKKRMRYAGGKRDKGILGTELAREILSQGPTKLKAAEKIFLEKGFAKSTAYTNMNILVRSSTAKFDQETKEFSLIPKD